MPSAPPAARGFSPLDDELALLPGVLTPGAHEGLVRLGTWLPFAPAAALLGFFRRITVSESTAQRLTERAGEAWVAVEEAAVTRLERELPDPCAGPAVQLLSVDGAMAPLVGGEWAEVKLLTIGTVEAVVGKEGKRVAQTTDLSYFARLAEAEQFGRLARVETQRRGTERAGIVVAVADGARWIAGFVDWHRPDAVRILDFAHAAEHLTVAAQAVYGAGTPACAAWLDAQCHALKHGEPTAVLAGVRALGDGYAPESTVGTAVSACAHYLEPRLAQMQYATFQALGYPIGSGSVESGNKVVMEARLKGAGMRWARRHINPMVALRTIACNDRWEEAWSGIVDEQRMAHRQCVAARRVNRRAEATPMLLPLPTPPARRRPPPTTRPPLPAAAHPWRQTFLAQARRSAPSGSLTTKI